MIETNFKQTEVGLLPEEWEARLVAKAFSFVGNNTCARELMSETGKVHNIHYGDILIKYGAVVNISTDNVPFLSDSVREIAKNPLQDGDVLMADTAEDETVGKCCEVIGVNNKQVETGLHSFGLRPNDKYAPKFLGYAFNSSQYHDQLLPHIQGTKVSSISKASVGKTYLCCPKDEKEQREIANALSDIDELISSLNKLIEKKKSIKLAVMQQLLTGKKRIQGYSKPWEDKKISELGTLQKGNITPYLYPNEEFVEYSMPAFDEGQNPIRCKGQSMNSARTMLNGKVLLVNKLNVRQKRIWLVFANTKNSVCSGEFLPFVSTKCSLEFLKQLLLTDSIVKDWNENSSGTSNSQKRITPAYMLSYKIHIPSDVSEQIAIANVLDDMDEEIIQLGTRKKKFEAIKQGMMQQLLSGKIRLL